MRPSMLVLPVALAALVAATFVVALGVLREEERPPAAPAATAPTGEPRRTAQEEPAPAADARELFAHTCGGCHALADAGTAGMFGPDLDAARPSAARVRRAIRTGSLDGVMQPRLLDGADARRVAAYVARVAGD